MPKKQKKQKSEIRGSTARKTTTPAVVEAARAAAASGGRARARKAAETGAPQRKLSPKQEEQMLRRERTVMEKRVRGWSFYRIEKETGISNAERVFRRAIEREENIEFRRQEALRLEEKRLDDLQDGIWDRALAGEPRAVEVALKVLERRARLLGLDFADMISSRLVEIEKAKVEVLATALVEVFKEAGLSPEQQRTAVPLFFRRVRALSGVDTVQSEVVSSG